MTEQNSQHSLSNRFFMKIAGRRFRAYSKLEARQYQEGTSVMSRDHPMSKRTIIRLFVGAIVAAAAGPVIVLAALWAAVASDLVVTVTLAVVGSLAMLAAPVAGVVSWIGAMLNTAHLEDKTWFVSLLVLGLFSAGLLAMAASVLAGPDGKRQGISPPGIALARTHHETEMH